jgi:hypothetical protein
VATLADRYAPDENEVTAKVLDGEAIIINLLTGVYYSMDGAGALVWQGIEQSATVGEIVDALSARTPSERARIESDILALVEQLLAEKMLKPAASPTATFLLEVSSLPSTWTTPELVVYRDMAEVLALDPPTPGVFDSLLKDPDPTAGNR